QFLEFFGLGALQILLRVFSFSAVAAYIVIPFMILPIFIAFDDLDKNLINSSRDLGASPWLTFTYVIFPISMNGVRSG
ncbi:ABC transporter permease, partial [Streptococcus suis]